MKKVVVITGRLYTGKSGLARLLASEFGFTHLKTSDLLREHARTVEAGTDRISLQELGDKLDIETGGRRLLEKVKEILAKDEDVVVDSLRTREQINLLRQSRY